VHRDDPVELCRIDGASGVHITFATEDEYRFLGELGFLQRTDQQFHWENHGYASFDEFLAALDSESRAYLQELLAGAGEGLKENGKALAATFKRFAPTARLVQEIAAQVEIRHANVARSIHNFRLLMEALGSKDKQLSSLVDASNAVFATFAKEDRNVQATLRLLPGALTKTRSGLGKLATAASLLGPTLHQLRPFARSLDAAQHATIRLANATTPIIRDQVRPFARQILPDHDAEEDEKDCGCGDTER